MTTTVHISIQGNKEVEVTVDGQPSFLMLPHEYQNVLVHGEVGVSIKETVRWANQDHTLCTVSNNPA